MGDIKTEGIKNVVEIMGEKSEIFLEIPEYFNHLFSTYMPFFIIIAISLLVGLGVVILVVGVGEEG